MTPWLRATVLAVVLVASTAVGPLESWCYGVEQGYGGGRGYGTQQSHGNGSAYGAEPVRRSGSLTRASSPSGRPPDPAPGPRSASASMPARGPEATAGASSPFRPSGAPVNSSPPHGPLRASPSASLAPTPSAATPSRAGSRAGEGRERPGRREKPEETDAAGADPSGAGDGHDDGDLAAVSDPPRETAVAPPSRPAKQPAGQSAERPVASPRVFILPLGTGLVLVGLGLGIGLFALRIRRG
ncbi:hypothetical protein AB0D34_03510 [Streptomyces sp. NPDC048420]|uniref:hypothetical protein n=1 Tax=Streptomyces sp. NPDC048420 TaxID=3155755 RepID=UPI0034349980